MVFNLIVQKLIFGRISFFLKKNLQSCNKLLFKIYVIATTVEKIALLKKGISTILSLGQPNKAKHNLEN